MNMGPWSAFIVYHPAMKFYQYNDSNLLDILTAVAIFDLNILPIHRINDQELASLPGLLAVTPPRRRGRGREQDYLIIYLMLSGNAAFSASEVKHLMDNRSEEHTSELQSLAYLVC